MTKLRAHSIAVSLDGFAAGPSQDLGNPMGIGGERLHPWMFETAFGRAMMGKTGGTTGIDNDYLLAGVENVGAHIMGRNMFGPIRSEWGDSDWDGWWGDTPPYGHDVFVLTHYARDPLVMKGGTTFHFVTEGPEIALEQAVAAAGGQDVRVGGGAATIRQYLDLGLLDELHMVISPVLLGSGERLLDGAYDLDVVDVVSSEKVTHVRLAKR